MPLGSNGEFHSLSDAESLAVVRTVRENAAPDKIIMAGAERESAYATIECIKGFCDVGIDYASVLTPSYFASKMDEDALCRYFIEVADHSPVPVLLYCAPKFAAGIVITPRIVSRLCEHPNIVGMKDTSSNDISIYCNAVKENANFYVLSGSISKYLKGRNAGAVGGVLSPLDYIPERCCEIEALWNAGDSEAAEKLSNEIIEINNRSVAKFGVCGVKYAMNLMGYKGGMPRNPLAPLTKQEQEQIHSVFHEAGYLV
jgi:4-hydroxy-2-oxoglutarate aldolase